MALPVLLTADAERDLEDLYDYLVDSESRSKADYVLDRILQTAESLAALPERGSQPKELRPLGIHDYRQVFFKPYRLIYRVFETAVIVYLIADGRRDVQGLLARRLLGR